MNIFIDIEASNKKDRSSICNIALIVTDNNLNEIERLNIIINPEVAYDMSVLDIGINETELINKPTFPQVYPLLSKYINSNNLIIGHATKCDVLMLEKACRRYNLPIFQYQFLCTQVLHTCIINNIDINISLKGLAKIYDINFRPHRAQEDAYATFEILKKMIEIENKSLPHLLNKYQIILGKAGISDCTSQTILESRNKNKIRKLEDKVRLNIPLSKKEGAKLIEYYATKIDYTKLLPLEEQVLKGQFICMNRLLERSNLSSTKKIIMAIKELGGKYSTSLDKCTTYINNEDISNDRRLKNYLKVSKLHNKEAKTIEYQQFIKIINQHLKNQERELVKA